MPPAPTTLNAGGAGGVAPPAPAPPILALEIAPLAILLPTFTLFILFILAKPAAAAIPACMNGYGGKMLLWDFCCCFKCFISLLCAQ